MADLFKFKQFDVDQANCAMKVNTDGALLGALTKAGNPQTILDIGTGTGVIALMLAQRFPNALIDAVEIDEAAAQTAGSNFSNSPFADRLSLYPDSFESFFDRNPGKNYDLIVSNPPFYINSLQSPGAGKKLAKHADAGFFRMLIEGSAKHLNHTGALWLILPIDTSALVKGLANEYKLYLKQVISISSYPDSTPHRELLAFGLQGTQCTECQFVIYDELKKYSKQYEEALKVFFTIF